MGQDSWKAAKEAFVTGHGGSSLADVAVVSMIVPLCVGLRLHLGSLTAGGRARDTILDLAVVVAPIAVALTVGSDAAAPACCALAAGVAACRWWRGPRGAGARVGGRATVRLFRVGGAVATATCILAVDFRCFPRRFAKTDRYGLSVMDLGSGVAVFGNALSSRTARGAGRRGARAAPLAALALARYAAVALAAYPAPVAEYGAHWNFFATLAVVEVLGDALAGAALGGRRGAVVTCGAAVSAAVCACAAHALVDGEYVLGDAPRDTFLSANREGLASLPGYLAIWYAGLALARPLHAALDRGSALPLAAVAAAALKGSEVLGPPSRRPVLESITGKTAGLGYLQTPLPRSNRTRFA